MNNKRNVLFRSIVVYGLLFIPLCNAAEQISLLKNLADALSNQHPEPLEMELSAQECYEQSIEWLNKGSQRNAEKLIDDACRVYYNNPDLLFAQAVLQRSRWYISKSRTTFRKCRKYATTPSMKKRVGLTLHLNSGRQAKKMPEFIKYCALYQDDLYLQWLLAIYCREYNRGKLGAETYEKLLNQLNPGPVMMHHTYANILTEELQEYDKALEHRYIAVSMEQKGWTLQGLGNTLREAGRYDEGVEAFRRAVQIDPDDAQYQYQLGVTLHEGGRYEEAIEAYRKAIELKGRLSWNTKNNIADCYEKLGRMDEAVATYEEASNFLNPDAKKRLAEIYFFGLGVPPDETKALKYFYKWTMKKDPAEAMYTAARKVKRTETAHAISYLEKAIELNPEHYMALNELAWLLGTTKQAQYRDLNRALELAIKSVNLNINLYNRDTLAVIYRELGMPVKARETRKLQLQDRPRKWSLSDGILFIFITVAGSILILMILSAVRALCKAVTPKKSA